MPQKLVFLSGDLFFAGRVRGACEARDLEFQFFGRLPTTDPLTADDEVAYLVVDLSSKGNVPEKIVPLARQLYPSAELMAYAPHVHTEALAAAKAAEFDTVMTRGAFNAWLQR